MAKAKTILPLVSEDALQSSLTKSGRPGVCRFFLLCRTGIIQTSLRAILFGAFNSRCLTICILLPAFRPCKIIRKSLALRSPQLIPTRIGKASDAVQAEIGGAEPGSYYSGPACRSGIIRTCLGAILFSTFNSRCFPISRNATLQTDGERMKKCARRRERELIRTEARKVCGKLRDRSRRRHSCGCENRSARTKSRCPAQAGHP